MTIQVQQIDEAKIRLSGDLLMPHIQNCINDIEQIMGNLGERFVVDLSGVLSSDSAGLALLVHIFRLAKHANQEVVFNMMPRKMQDIARVCGLDSVLRPEL